MILARCGHTVCQQCVDLRLRTRDDKEKQCPECREWTPISDIHTNKKVLKIMEIAQSEEVVTEDPDLGNKLELASVKSQVVNAPVKTTQSEVTDMSRVFCYKH